MNDKEKRTVMQLSARTFRYEVSIQATVEAEFGSLR